MSGRENCLRKVRPFWILGHLLVLTDISRVDESAWGTCPPRFCGPRSDVCRHGCRRSFRQPSCWLEIETGPPRSMDAALSNRPIAPGTSAKSSAPLGQRFFRELFSFLASPTARLRPNPQGFTHTRIGFVAHRALPVELTLSFSCANPDGSLARKVGQENGYLVGRRVRANIPVRLHVVLGKIAVSAGPPRTHARWSHPT